MPVVEKQLSLELSKDELIRIKFFAVAEFVISRHAQKRFVERWLLHCLDKPVPDDPLEMLKNILLWSRRASKPDPADKAEHWRFNEWRLVIVESGPGAKVLVTAVYRE